MTHRVPESETPEPAPVAWSQEPKSRNMFQEKYLPHLAMAAVTAFYIAFYVSTGAASGDFTGAAVPQTISLAWTGTLATWFGYCIRQRSATKGEK